MEIIEKAPAKINLGLDIVGRCDDGYHELSMVMVSVDLSDYVILSELPSDEIIITSNNHRMPLNRKNDVYKAIKLIQDTYHIKRGIKVELQKTIPICAGLGGGSSDAAATLRALNRLWQLHLDQDTLIDLAFTIGSDVPYCLQAGCAWIGGKGELVEPIDACLSSWVVLVKPQFGISTRTIFKEIDPEAISRVDITGLKAALLADDYESMLACMGNSLEDISIRKRPFIQKIKDKMLAAGADIALMTGSGPTVFALCPTEKRANRVVNSMKGFCKEVYKVRILS